MLSLNRRSFIRGCSTISATSVVCGSALAGIAGQPSFPGVSGPDFRITDFGAVEGGHSLCTDAIHNALDACARAGGGRVVVPSGKFLTDTLYLRSHTELHLEEGAMLAFRRNASTATDAQGVHTPDYQPRLYAIKCVNVAVTGPGTIDCGGREGDWWYGKGHALNQQNQVEDVLLHTEYSRNVRVDGIAITQSPDWLVKPWKSENVIVDNVVSMKLLSAHEVVPV